MNCAVGFSQSWRTSCAKWSLGEWRVGGWGVGGCGFGEGLIVMLMSGGTDSSWSVSCLWHVNNAAYAMNYGYAVKDKDPLLFLTLPRRPEGALSCPRTTGCHLQFGAECWTSRGCWWEAGKQIVWRCRGNVCGVMNAWSAEPPTEHRRISGLFRMPPRLWEKKKPNRNQ